MTEARQALGVPMSPPLISPDGLWEWSGSGWVARTPAASAVDQLVIPSTDHASPNGLAIASLVLGIAWIGGVGSILAAWLGYRARAAIKRTGEHGSVLAATGLTLGCIGTVVAVLVATLLLWPQHHASTTKPPAPLAQQSQAHDASVKSDLRSVANEMETYFTDNQVYPSGLVSQTGAITVGADVVTLDAGNTIRVVQAGNNGFCLLGSNTNASHTWYYDSINGGITVSDCSDGSGY